jgi:hypothetical protein
LADNYRITLPGPPEGMASSATVQFDSTGRCIVNETIKLIPISEAEAQSNQIKNNANYTFETVFRSITANKDVVANYNEMGQGIRPLNSYSKSLHSQSHYNELLGQPLTALDVDLSWTYHDGSSVPDWMGATNTASWYSPTGWTIDYNNIYFPSSVTEQSEAGFHWSPCIGSCYYHEHEHDHLLNGGTASVTFYLQGTPVPGGSWSSSWWYTS